MHLGNFKIEILDFSFHFSILDCFLPRLLLRFLVAVAAPQSDESIWGCEQVKNTSCAAENDLWPCDSSGTDDTVECIRRSRVCDGRNFKDAANNCPGGNTDSLTFIN